MFILNLENSVFNNLKENEFVRNFINELSDYLKNNFDHKEDDVPIIEDILSNNNLTTVNKRSIIWNEEDVILKYAEKMKNDNPMYFVKDSKKAYWLNNKEHYKNDVYAILKVQNNEIQELEISKKDMPKDVGVNDVFIIENGHYVVDIIATKELREEIIKMANEIINKQNMKLDEHRKEGHLYMVTEEVGNNRFLRDVTNYSKIEFEEIDIPKELLEKATEGMILKYTNGKYEFYSDDEFEEKDDSNKN